MRLPRKIAFVGLWALLSVLVAPGCSRSRDPEKYLQSGNRFYQAREFEKAKVEYMNAMRLQSTNAVAIMQLGKIFYRQGQLREAAPFLLEGRRHFPGDVESAHQLATIYLAAGDYEKARIAARAVLEREPAQEVALTVLSDATRTPQEAQELIALMDQLQSKAGNRAIFHVVRAQLAQRSRDLKRAEGELQMAVTIEPKSPTAHLSLAMLRWGQGATNQAEQSFRAAAQLAGPDDPAKFRLANFLYRTERVDEAKQVLEEVTKTTPERTAAWNLRAEIALREQNFQECDRLLDRVLGQTPNDMEARMLQAKLRLAQKKPEQAVKLLESLAESRPRSGDIQYQLGVAHLANKDPRQAAVSLSKAVSLDTNNVSATLLLSEVNISRGQNATAITMLTDLIRRAPNYAPAQFLLGRAYVTGGQWNNALALYRDMRTRFPKDPNVSLQLGLVLRQRDQLDAARSAFEEARALAPNDAAPIEQLVDLELAAQANAKARALLEPELQRMPNSSRLWVQRARIALAENDNAAAKAALEKAIENDADNLTAYLMLADFHLRSGQPKESLSGLEAVIAKNPTNVRALLLWGLINSQLGNLDDAQKAYESILKINPNNVLALNNLAYVLSEHRGRLDQAYVPAAKARELSPADPTIADTMGWIEFRRGNYSESLRLLAGARDGLRGRPEFEAHLGLAQYMMGLEAEARQAFAVALKSDDQYASRALTEQRQLTLDALAITDPEKLVAALEQRRRDDPQDLIAWLRLGTAYESMGKIEPAREAYEAALKINPVSLPVLHRLIGLEMDRNPARASELARQAQQLDPDDPNLVFTLGHLALKSGEVASAYGLLQTSARQLTNQPVVWFDLAEAAFGMGRLAESAEALRAGLRLGGLAGVTNAAQTSLALLTWAQDPRAAAQALPQIQKALAANTNSGQAQFALAIADQQQGKFAEARDAHERLLQRYPQFTPSMRQLAILYGEHLKDDARAFEFATKARVALPNDDSLAKTLGALSFRRGDFRYAAQLFSEAARNRPQDADLQFQLGLAYLRLKRLPESRAALEKAIALDPQGAFVEEAQRLLAESKSG